MSKISKKVIIFSLVLALISLFVVALYNVYNKDNKSFTKVNLNEKKKFYNNGSDLITQGVQLDMKYEFMNSIHPLESEISFYFKSEKFKGLEQMIIELKEKTTGSIELIKLESDSYDFDNLFVPSSFNKYNRYYKFKISNFLIGEETEINNKKISPNEIVFKIKIDGKTEEFDLKTNNKQMINYHVKNLNNESKQVLHDFDYTSLKNKNNDYKILIHNCTVMYFYDKGKWKEMINEFCQDLLLSPKADSIISLDKLNPIIIFYPCLNDDERTYDTSYFIYKKLEELYKNKDHLSKNIKKEIVRAIAILNTDLQKFSNSEIKAFVKEEWNQEKNINQLFE